MLHNVRSSRAEPQCDGPFLPLLPHVSSVLDEGIRNLQVPRLVGRLVHYRMGGGSTLVAAPTALKLSQQSVRQPAMSGTVIEIISGPGTPQGEEPTMYKRTRASEVMLTAASI